MLDRLESPSGRPFAAFTFDDGFADSLTHALPVMERFGAPMTVYVATGMIEHSMDGWWLGLAEWIRRSDRVALPEAGLSFDCADPAAKKRAFVAIEAAIHRDYALLTPVRAAIAAHGIDCGKQIEREALTVEQLRQLSRHPLVTIGAHGDTHINLARASVETVHHEMTSNRRFLEALIDKPVLHFAYPFGNARACGAREAAIASAVGFRTAVTTRSGAIFPAHLDHPHALPREGPVGRRHAVVVALQAQRRLPRIPFAARQSGREHVDAHEIRRCHALSRRTDRRLVADVAAGGGAGAER